MEADFRSNATSDWLLSRSCRRLTTRSCNSSCSIRSRSEEPDPPLLKTDLCQNKELQSLSKDGHKTRGLQSLSKERVTERVTVSVKRKNYSLCQKKELQSLSKERVTVSVKRKSYSLCQKKDFQSLSKERITISVKRLTQNKRISLYQKTDTKLNDNSLCQKMDSLGKTRVKLCEFAKPKEKNVLVS